MIEINSALTFRNGIGAKNRVALAAMTNLQSHADGTLSDDELAWLTRRILGGFGVVTTCASHVSKDGQGWAGELGCFSDAHIPGLRTIATVCKGNDALAFAQIFHGGLRADPKVTGTRPLSASDGGPSGPRAATEGDLARIIDDFANAAQRAFVAGMHGVEIHGAHGYLLTQFLSATENRRTDAWGGSLAHRARLIREVLRAVKRKVPREFVVGVRLSPENFGNAKGLDLDESVQVAKWLCDDGADFIHLSLWDAHKNTTKRPHEHALQVFRPALPHDVRVLVAGKIWSRADAQALLDRGADAVALARSAIRYPAWPREIERADFAPAQPPYSPAVLASLGVSATFMDYLRARPGFMTDGTAAK